MKYLTQNTKREAKIERSQQASLRKRRSSSAKQQISRTPSKSTLHTEDIYLFMATRRMVQQKESLNI